LDLGCGSGYSMKKAIDDCKCITTGLDPQPMLAGVKTDIVEDVNFKIIKGVGEAMPFNDKEFDVVYSSHVLEHVQNQEKVLYEIKRVLKDDGVLIIGVPTSALACLGLLASIFYTTHIRLARFFAGFFVNVRKTKLSHVFFSYSHSTNKTALYDIKNYKIRKWRVLISKQFNITNEILPGLFQFAEYKFFFKIIKNKRLSSSVFFICKK